MNIENLSRMRALQSAYDSKNTMLVDVLLSTAHPDARLKRVQFDTSVELSERLDQVTVLLGTSRREFMELALVDAIQKSEETFYGTFKTVTGEDFGEVV